VSCTSPVSASIATSARCAPLGKVAAPFGPKFGPLGKPGFDLVGQLRGVEGVLGDLADIDRPVGAGDDELAIREHNVVARRLHHMGGDAATLVDQLVGRHDDCRAGKLRRA
jgi:hypothetical protein